MGKFFQHTAMIFYSLILKLLIECKDSRLWTEFATFYSVSKTSISLCKAQFQQNYKDSSLFDFEAGPITDSTNYSY